MTNNEARIEGTTSETATLEQAPGMQKVQITLVGLTPWTVEVNPLEPWDFEPFYQS
jgi:squalene cyclase